MSASYNMVKLRNVPSESSLKWNALLYVRPLVTDGMEKQLPGLSLIRGVIKRTYYSFLCCTLRSMDLSIRVSPGRWDTYRGPRGLRAEREEATIPAVKYQSDGFRKGSRFSIVNLHDQNIAREKRTFIKMASRSWFYSRLVLFQSSLKVSSLFLLPIF